MDTPKVHDISKNKISPAKLGVVIGAIFGLLGTVAGFYSGVIRPALSSGQLHELPMRSIWMGIILGVALIVVCGFFLWRWVCGPRPPPTGDEGEEW